MKNNLTLLLLSFLCAVAFMKAQAPQEVSYQAIIRDADNYLVKNQAIGLKISILKGSTSGTLVFSQTQVSTTNSNGLVTLKIGGTGFNAIDWADGPYFIKTETDPTGGTNYTIVGTNQLLSVPYALHAKSAESFTGTFIETDPSFSANFSLTNATTGDLLQFNGTKWVKVTPNYLSTEVDPAVTAHFDFTSAASGDLLQFNGTKWVKVTPNYLSTEVDPAVTAHFDFTSAASGDLLQFNGTKWVKVTPNYLSTEVDPAVTAHFDFTSAASGDLLQFNGTKWVKVTPNYLSTEVDPAVTAHFDFTSAASGDLLKFNGTKWVKVTPNYLSTEVDPAVTANFDFTDATTGDMLQFNGTKWVKVTSKYPASGTLNGQMLYWNGTTWEKITPSTDGLPLVICNGVPRWGGCLAVLTTSNITSISYTSATSGVTISNEGGSAIIEKGVCYSTSPSPTISDTKTSNGAGGGAAISTLSNLLSNTVYYVRAYATNTAGTTYGNELSFTTLPLESPTVTTADVYNISFTTALGGGNVISEGGAALTERGICWSISPNPTISDAKVTAGTTLGSFNALMTGLNSNTLYYVRAYAKNTVGTTYGEEKSFTTNTLNLASITTTAVSAVAYTSASSGGNVTADNGSSVTSRGICWSTTTAPTTAHSNYTEAGSVGTFTASITGLSANTTYYVRAFAINGAGTVYGNQYSFTTLALTAPALTTKSISGISSNIAGSGGTIIADGGSAITAKGICWSLDPSPTLANSFTTDGVGAASYNSTMNGLNPLTLYYVRAYATNSLGTTYGNQLSFTTTDLVFPGPSIPTIGTSASAIGSSSTASSGGYISADGGSAITARGVCWSTSQNPTVADNFSMDGTGMGFFSSTITGLSGCGTVYYVRAYATNSTGTAYGNQNSVSTGLLPTITTDDVSSIDFYSAVSGGHVTNDGGCTITQKGICWSYTPNPTIGNSKTLEGTGTAAFVSSITGLNANRTYYVRAYATNSVGTSYGPEKVFTTATPTTPYIGQNYAGGIVFYIDETGLHGLVCAPTDQGYYPWGCDGTLIGGTSTAFGTGATNTAAIVASCSVTGSAAKICDDLVLNSYSDWYLPSLDELKLMRANLHIMGIGSFNIYNNYSSSSEFNINEKWQLHMYDNSVNRGPKWTSIPVRAIRAF